MMVEPSFISRFYFPFPLCLLFVCFWSTFVFYIISAFDYCQTPAKFNYFQTKKKLIFRKKEAFYFLIGK